jgi:molybdopterin-guanine dinucleotide biosynthesis protein A
VKNHDDLPEYPFEKIVDQFPAIGPLGGITSALKTLNQRIFCVACDMPFLDGLLIESLCGFT